ncbi:MAG TPA: hypothetical protein VGT41_06360 [Candidatus Babeliales bacterium]|nr:hypothetical protein [Candidatus Babeliales bacterium]
MFNWRITKYNPKYRNTNGVYLKNEWTSYSDIEKQFSNEVLTFDDYIKIENRYIEATRLLMKCANITSLHLDSLEISDVDKEDVHLSASMVEVFDRLQEGLVVDLSMLDDVVRLILREVIWGKLQTKNFYVHFGYDYYMYVGSIDRSIEAIKKIEDLGLFVEPYSSPYK